MTKNLFIILVAILFYQTTFAQNASDILENGKPVKKGNRIFLKYDLSDKKLKIDDVKRDQEVDFTTMEDSLIYLVRKNAVNVYLRPLNPLNYTYKTETKIIIDPINEAAEVALGEIIGVLDDVINPQKLAPPAATPGAPLPNCNEFDSLKVAVKNIQKELSDSRKEKISEIFLDLKAIPFTDESSTIEAIKTTSADIKKIETHFEKIEKSISETKDKVEALPCTNPDPFILKYILNSILNEFSATLEEYKKRLSNLSTAHKLVKDQQVKASIGGGTNELKWCIPLDEVASKEGKISIYTVSIEESGYKLSDSKEIVSVEAKEVVKKSLRVRKFQRFVPEVSIGTAFTFFKYNTYGTTSDSLGVQYVASPTENLVRNINITTMINFNYYIPNSPIHPLYQVGVGINSGIPTLMSGLGMRIKTGQRRIAITGGIAMTWVKELNELNVGDEVSGTDDIDKDLTFQFAKPTGYIGIQYNF